MGAIDRWNQATREQRREWAIACSVNNAWANVVADITSCTTWEELVSRLEVEYDKSSPEERLFAMNAHPRIGGLNSGHMGKKGMSWSQQEQGSVAQAAEILRRELHEYTHKYEEIHGFRYVIKALGKTPDMLLRILKERVDNPTEVEKAEGMAQEKLIMLTRLETLRGELDSTPANTTTTAPKL